MLPKLLALLLTAHAVWAAAAVYVAPGGSDRQDGSIDRPFATLERARDELRKGVARAVWVRGGVYALPRTLQLDQRDSGTADEPVVWRAMPGESVVLSGGAAISGFVPSEDGTLKASYRGAAFRMLFYNGRRQPLARYPNFDPENPYGGGWAYADGKPVPMYQDVPGEDRRTFQYRAADARPWSRAQEGEVMIFPRYNWWNNLVRIQAIDRDTRKVTLAADCSYPVRPGDRYYVQGMREELDAPGEWYLDVGEAALYFRPPDGASDPTVYAPRLSTILEMRAGTEHVVFRGFTFEHSSGTAITLTNTRHCRIAGNTIRNVGDYRGSGISIAGGSNNGAVGNDIYEIGAGGIAISGGDRITLTPADNFADNNYIHHTGVWYKQGVGISLNGCGNRATHNLIHDTPRMAILFSGNNLLIEYNHLRHTNLETADTGAVYTGGRDWISSRGTVIRYNYMHDSLGYGFENGKWTSPHYSWGVYLDDNTGGVDVVGNVVVRAYRGPIHLHNGRDNLIENNVFAEGKMQQAEFNGWTVDHSYWKTHLPTMIAGYNSVKDQPAWKNMRNMDVAPEDAPLPDGRIMTGNVFRRNIVYWTGDSARLFGSRNLPLERNEWNRNIYWRGGGPIRIALGGSLGEIDFEEWKRRGLDADSLVADPLFAGASRDDYRLLPDSPALALGFEPIPMEKIGPYADEVRASWPIVEAEGVREKPLR